jgi:hypothetical protein
MSRALAGLVYGGLLAGLSVIAAGAGHGTYIPMEVSSAPIGLFGAMAAATGAPIWWGGVSALLGWLHGVRRKRVVSLLLVIHYVSAALDASFGDWAYLSRSMPSIGAIIFTWVVVYVIGQLAIWRSVLARAQA